MESDVRRVAVIGAGFMGSGIGSELALRAPGVERVVLWDATDGAAQAAVGRAGDVARILVDAGVVAAHDADARLRRIGAATTLAEAVEGAEYVVEAVPEELSLKLEVFKRLDAAAAPDAVLASNTSGYDPADLATGLAHPERVVVAHYFGPAYLIPAVEVVPHQGTADWAVERTERLLRSAGKRTIRLGKFAPGFVANRLQQALFREALHLVREGIAAPEQIDELVRYSFAPRLAALGPMAVADFAGLDVYASLATNVWPTLSAEPAAGAPPAELAEMGANGRLGVKTGGGFYDWPEARRAVVAARRDGALSRALKD
jgi:3-hydroxybutyryl-CoA dehydrogenase